MKHETKEKRTYEILIVSVSRFTPSRVQNQAKIDGKRRRNGKKKRENLCIFATIDLFRGYVAAFCFDNELFKRLRCLATV